MTMEMILALGILVLMIVLIMSDKMPFGAPPLLACLLLVVSGLSTVQQAFAGFVNPSVVMIAGFMVVMAALQKTRLISNVKSAMISLVNKGSYRSYGLLLVIVMLGASLAGTGATGYYVLILSLVSTIPYSKKLPTSKLMMPLGFATNHPLLPINLALLFGVYGDRTRNRGVSSGDFDGALCAGESHHVSGFPRMESYCLRFLRIIPLRMLPRMRWRHARKRLTPFLPGKNIALLPHSLSALSA
mgnify:CR=1 FL=1